MLNWENIYARFVKLIKYAAYVVATRKNILSMMEDLTQEGQVLLYNCFNRYRDKSEKDFAPLFKTALWRHMDRISDRMCRCMGELTQMGGYPYNGEDYTVMDAATQLDRDSLAKTLEGEPLALLILNEFINPSDRTMWEARMDAERKKMIGLQRGHKTHTTHVEIRAQHVKRSLRLKPERFAYGMNALKDGIASVYC